MTLYLEKRGRNIDSKLNPTKAKLCDVGNYRVYTGDKTITGKNGKEYSIEFTGYNRRRNKVDTENALFLDVFVHSNDGTYRDEEAYWKIDKMNIRYTKSGILSAVNLISKDQYDEIKWYTSIEIEQETGENFTPYDKILEYAKQNRLEYSDTVDGIVLHLYTGDYKYLYYRIEQMPKQKERLIIVLKECE